MAKSKSRPPPPRDPHRPAMAVPIPALAALRTDFDTFLCFDHRTQAIIHLPPDRLTGELPLICTTGDSAPALQLVHADGRTAPLAPERLGGHSPALRLLPNGKLLISAGRKFLSARPNGTAACCEPQPGHLERFAPEPAAHAFAARQRRPLHLYRRAVFTAAGDRNNISRWLDGPRDFALIIAYYGDDDKVFAELRSRSDIAMREKGGKFQILKTLFSRQPGLFDGFDHILVSDDDLIWSAADIDRAFALAAQFDLWVCQPAFDPSGRISFPVTAHHPGPQSLRFTTYVEVTCPLFRADKLRAFLNVFDGSMTGYGICSWFCNFLGKGLNMKLAILDAVMTINPHESTKPTGLREIDLLRPLPQRVEDWEYAARNYNLRHIRPRNLGAIVLDHDQVRRAGED